MTVCFGEILLRLSPPGATRVVQAESFDAVYGGAETNVAVALAGFGDPSAVVTRLPEHEVGQACLNAVRRWGPDVSRILRGSGRMGIYFLEKGASLRPSKVIYDRAGSAFALSSPGMYDWEALLADAEFFFFTGITPALSETLPSVTADALAVCRKRGIPVFCDVNYRPTLWPADRAGEVMRSLARGIDTLIVNEEHAALLFGVSADSSEGGTPTPDEGEDDSARLTEIAARLSEEYGIRRVALTLRRSESSEINTVSGVLYENGTLYRSRPYRVPIVDRIGGGDAFSAGLIHGARMGWDPGKTVEFASAANALKHSVHGDALIASAAEVGRLADSADKAVRMIR
ncbi:MAG: sugar kinase [Clostridia bacterium]|nr:sugar kinase [Clostridia bacterium]